VLIDRGRRYNISILVDLGADRDYISSDLVYRLALSIRKQEGVSE